LEETGAVLLGKLNLDEFAMGATGEYSAYYPAVNPHDLTRMAGGSSSGSAASVAADHAVFSLGSDTGGSVRLPASFCGVVGMKPTYGRISRYGMIAFASSLDTVGIVTRTMRDNAMVLSVLAGADSMDATCSRHPVPDYLSSGGFSVKELRIGIPAEFYTDDLTPEVQNALEEVMEVYRNLGVKLCPMSLPVTEDSLAVYHILSSAEAASNLGRFDGVRFGARGAGDTSSEIADSTKEQFLGGEVQARIVSGEAYLLEENLDKFYKPALHKQKFIKTSFEEAFRQVDLILAPTATCVAPRIGDFSRGEKRAFDRFTVPASLAGLPSVSIPCKTNRTLPIGFQLVAPAFREDLLFLAGEAYEREVTADV
jgi:aspartyl-tRNA(Asn)/glutamyl-tRNA(Gln) amidotransferase subunit A